MKSPEKVKDDIYNTLGFNTKEKEREESSSEASVDRKELKKKDPDYYNFLYHDTDSQLGMGDRYVSEMRQIGREVKPAHRGSNTQRTSPKAS